MKKRFCLLMLVLLVLPAFLLAGCAAIRQSYDNYEYARHGAYQDTAARWTKEARVYRGFETVLLASGTYKSAEFRRAYVKKYSRDYFLDEKAESDLLAEELADGQKTYEFILAVYAPNKEKLNLASARSLWRVYLEGPTLPKLTPVEIRNLRKEKARLEAFYPNITPWNEVYRVRFQKPMSQGSESELQLVLTGALGTARLIFPPPHS